MPKNNRQRYGGVGIWYLGGARSKTKIRPNKQRRQMDLECE